MLVWRGPILGLLPPRDLLPVKGRDYPFRNAAGGMIRPDLQAQVPCVGGVRKAPLQACNQGQNDVQGVSWRRLIWRMSKN